MRLHCNLLVYKDVRIIASPLLFICASRLKQIVREDNRLRTACTDASQNASSGGAEGRLQLELSDLRVEEAALTSEVEAAEQRVRRYT